MSTIRVIFSFWFIAFCSAQLFGADSQIALSGPTMDLSFGISTDGKTLSARVPKEVWLKQPKLRVWRENPPLLVNQAADKVRDFYGLLGVDIVKVGEVTSIELRGDWLKTERNAEQVDKFYYVFKIMRLDEKEKSRFGNVVDYIVVLMTGDIFQATYR